MCHAVPCWETELVLGETPLDICEALIDNIPRGIGIDFTMVNDAWTKTTLLHVLEEAVDDAINRNDLGPFRVFKESLKTLPFWRKF